MPPTPKQQADLELSVFGWSRAEVREAIDQLVKHNHGDVSMSLGGILSDVQELIAADTQPSLELARQHLNQVKMALFAAEIRLWAKEDVMKLHQAEQLQQRTARPRSKRGSRSKGSKVRFPVP